MREKLKTICEKEFPKEFDNLQSIPGVKERSATSILAEIGADMKMFLTAVWHVLGEGVPYNDYNEAETKVEASS